VIYVIDTDGSNRQRLTTHVSPDWEPAWAPDGNRIAISAYRESDSEIYVINADGSNPIPLTNNETHDGYPSWSPDGTKIVFCTTRDGTWEIYVMATKGQTRNASQIIKRTTGFRSGHPMVVRLSLLLNGMIISKFTS